MPGRVWRCSFTHEGGKKSLEPAGVLEGAAR